MTARRRSGAARLAAAVAAAMLLTSVVVAAAVPAGAAPAAALPWTAVSVAAPGHAGYCSDGNGVTVVVDFQELGGGAVVRCATGPQATGLAALQNAGFAVTGTARWGLAFTCRIDGKPGPDREPCIDTPPANAYWSYWHAPNGGTWTYSRIGATGRTPPPGSFEGWSFSLDKPPGGSPPPGVPPLRPQPPATSPPAGPPPAGDAGNTPGSGDRSDDGSRDGSGDGSRDPQRPGGEADRPGGSATGAAPGSGTTATGPAGGDAPRSFGDGRPRTGAAWPTGTPPVPATPGSGAPAAPPSPAADLGLASQDLSDPAAARTAPGGPAGTAAGLTLVGAVVGAAVLTGHRRRRARP